MFFHKSDDRAGIVSQGNGGPLFTAATWESWGQGWNEHSYGFGDGDEVLSMPQMMS